VRRSKPDLSGMGQWKVAYFREHGSEL